MKKFIDQLIESGAVWCVLGMVACLAAGLCGALCHGLL